MKLLIDIDWDIIKNCSSQIKKKKVAYVNKLVNVFDEFYTLGIEAFEKEIENTEDNFKIIGYKLLISGESPNFITLVLSNLLLCYKESPEDYLDRIIFMHHILLMQKEGIGLRDMRCILLSYLGKDVEDDIAKWVKQVY